MQTQGGLGAFDGGLYRFFAIVGFFFEKECAHRADVSLSKKSLLAMKLEGKIVDEAPHRYLLPGDYPK
jgi:hypothetical protein